MVFCGMYLLIHDSTSTTSEVKARINNYTPLVYIYSCPNVDAGLDDIV